MTKSRTSGTTGEARWDYAVGNRRTGYSHVAGRESRVGTDTAKDLTPRVSGHYGSSRPRLKINAMLLNIDAM